MSAPGWSLLPHMIMRSTGFPFELIESLTCAATAAAIDRLLELEEALRQVEALLDEEAERLLAAQEVAVAALRAVGKQVRKGAPVAPELLTNLPSRLAGLAEERNRLLPLLSAANHAARKEFDREVLQARTRLREIVADPRFGEACFLSSPQMYEHGVRSYLRTWQPQRSSEQKRLERQLISYLQRFCCKNETTSFFGPINYGLLDEQKPGGVVFSPVPGTARREAFLAYWAVKALAERIAGEPECFPFLTVRRHPACTEAPDGGFLLHGAETRHLPDGPEAALLGMVPHGLSVSALSSRLQEIGWSEQRVHTVLTAFQKAGLVSVELAVPVTAIRALDVLIARLAELPAGCPARERWLAELQGLASAVAQFGQGELAEKRPLLEAIEARFQRLTGQAARRSGGNLYADRLLVYEEALGAQGPVQVGSDLTRELHRQLAPALTLSAVAGLSRRRALQQSMQGLFEQLSADNAPVPFARFLRQAGEAHLARFPDADPVSRLHAIVAARSGEACVQVDPESLGLPDAAALAADGLVTSPDVLVTAATPGAAEAGCYTVVLGECHDTAMLWGWALAFHPDAELVTASVSDLLKALPEQARLANVLSSKRVKIVPFEYPGYTLEVQAASERPSQMRIPIAEVLVENTSEGLCLTVPSRGLRGLRLYNGELDSPAHGAFALPRCVPPTVDCGQHTPRILLGDLVYQRERWRLRRDSLLPGKYEGSCFELFRDVRAAARRHGLPRSLYVRVPSERKPFYLDTANFLLIELLEYFVRQADSVILTEMLPAPEQLWLQPGNGRYCSEFRLCAFHRPPDEVTYA